MSAGVEALTAAFPALYGARVWICLLVLALITAANMWGVVESARIFMVPTLAFIAAMAVVIIGGLSGRSRTWRCRTRCRPSPIRSACC